MNDVETSEILDLGVSVGAVKVSGGDHPSIQVTLTIPLTASTAKYLPFLGDAARLGSMVVDMKLVQQRLREVQVSGPQFPGWKEMFGEDGSPARPCGICNQSTEFKQAEGEPVSDPPVVVEQDGLAFHERCLKVRDENPCEGTDCVHAKGVCRNWQDAPAVDLVCAGCEHVKTQHSGGGCMALVGGEPCPCDKSQEWVSENRAAHVEPREDVILCSTEDCGHPASAHKDEGGCTVMVKKRRSLIKCECEARKEAVLAEQTFCLTVVCGHLATQHSGPDEAEHCLAVVGDNGEGCECILSRQSVMNPAADELKFEDGPEAE